MAALPLKIQILKLACERRSFLFFIFYFLKYSKISILLLEVRILKLALRAICGKQKFQRCPLYLLILICGIVL
jgi:hypothetical protein